MQVSGEEMDNKVICEKCGAQMRHVLENSVQGWSCLNCGWGVLTTWMDEIYRDSTKYSILLNPSGEAAIGKIRLIAKIAGVNYIASRKLLIDGGICVENKKAPEIKKAAGQLQAAGISFKITPTFRH